MRKYILFAGHHYYPRGGIKDCVSASDDINELAALAMKSDNYGPDYEWAHIVDASTLKIVWRTRCECDGSDRETEGLT